MYLTALMLIKNVEMRSSAVCIDPEEIRQPANFRLGMRDNLKCKRQLNYKVWLIPSLELPRSLLHGIIQI